MADNVADGLQALNINKEKDVSTFKLISLYFGITEVFWHLNLPILANLKP